MELARHHVGFSCPDFNQPAFETLTVSRMLDQTRAAVSAAPDGPIALIGSSLGGFVALHTAAGDTSGRIARLVLLAPALDFGGNRLRQLGEQGIDEWRRTGRLRVFHYADNVHRDVGFALYADAAQYDAWSLAVTLPIVVFQGTKDASVDPAMVERWARARSNVELHLLDDGHQLTESMDRIWSTSQRFLQIRDAP
jgi:alpha-beta hydrolase superfamily lysophospholipase